MRELSMDNKREKFEQWFNSNYEWFIEKGRSGYSLERFEQPPYQYIQDVPHHDWRVWQAATLSVDDG